MKGLLFLGKLLGILLQKGVIGNAIAMLLVSLVMGYFGYGYVEAKHQEGTARVAENKKQIEQLAKNQAQIVTTLKVMQTTLGNMNDNVAIIRDDLKTTKDRVWKIHENQKRKVD